AKCCGSSGASVRYAARQAEYSRLQASKSSFSITVLLGLVGAVLHGGPPRRGPGRATEASRLSRGRFTRSDRIHAGDHVGLLSSRFPADKKNSTSVRRPHASPTCEWPPSLLQAVTSHAPRAPRSAEDSPPHARYRSRRSPPTGPPRRPHRTPRTAQARPHRARAPAG